MNQIGIKDVHDGYHVRELLEGDAAYLAARHISAEDLAQLTELVPPDPARKATNREFHMRIATASKNQRPVRMVRVIYDDVLRIIDA